MSALVNLCPPCDHNAWNNARMKGRTASLTCRFCPAQWKATNLMEIVCPEFRETGRCPLSVSCPYLHIYRHKREDLSPTNMADAQTAVDQILRRAALEVITSRQASGRVLPSTIMSQVRQVAQVMRLCDSEPTSMLHSPCSVLSANTSFCGDAPSTIAQSIACNDSPHTPVSSIDDEMIPFTRKSSFPESPNKPSSACSPTKLLPVTSSYVPLQRSMWASRRNSEV